MITYATPFLRISDFILKYKYVLLFYLIIILLIFIFRKKFEVQAKFIALFRTKFGLKFMDYIAKKYNWFVKNLSYIGVPLGYLGMLAIVYAIIHGIYTLFFVPSAPPAVAAVLPGLPVAGTGIKIPFFQGIIAFFIVILIHEFCHGVVARANNIHVKSSGFVMFGPIPGAFVEPDEEEIKKRVKHPAPNKEPFPWIFTITISLLFFAFIYFFSIKSFNIVNSYPSIFIAIIALLFLFTIYTARYFHKKNFFHLAIFSAGPFSNILTAILVFLVMIFVFSPSASSFTDPAGFGFISIENNTPAHDSDLEPFVVYNRINNKSILSLEEFKNELKQYSPNDTITIGNESVSIPVTLTNNPENLTKPYLGVQITDITELKPGMMPKIFAWFLSLFNWLFILSLGLGLANLLPLGPVDGGRMFQVILHLFVGEKKGNVIWTKVAIILLAIIILLFFAPIFKYLFS